MTNNEDIEHGCNECNCNECNCGDNCSCSPEHKCSEDCCCGEEKCCNESDCQCENNSCIDECECDNQSEEKCSCDECEINESQDEEPISSENSCQDSKAEEYLNIARQLQADFDNYRKRVQEDIKSSRLAGQVSMLEAILPCLDTFKEAKKMITDVQILEGVEMIENKIIDTLKAQGVEKIESIGQKYNPAFHNVIAVMRKEDEENDIILDEYQAGYTFGGKVIRYSKVIVNKKED